MDPNATNHGHLPADHPAVAAEKVGVLLINLGTPDGTDYWSVRRYLKEFLSDPRVIEVNRLVWWFVLNGIILSFRPFKAGHAYKEIWDEERNESPLRTITRAQSERLGADLAGHGIEVEWGMRYGNPSIADKLEVLREKGCTRILLAALYPQYSATTTATAYDKAFDALKTMRWQPAVRTLPAYHDDPAYIAALVRSIHNDIAQSGTEPDCVLASFHGLPKRYLLNGDPYHCQCVKTARLMREALGWDETRLTFAFQSRFGAEEWLRPYADQTVERLARDGVKRLAVITPGFSADCVETLEEVNMGLRETFLEAGGESFRFIPSLNASDEGMSVIRALVSRELSGWIDVPATSEETAPVARLAASR